MSLSLLHTNDLHGHLTSETKGALQAWRAESDLYFDTGDAIKAGNLAIPLRPEAVWQDLAELRCTASVPGNRESHPLAAGWSAKTAGLSHPLLCGNFRFKNGALVLPGSLELEVQGIRVGVLGVMVPMVTERMKASLAASAFVWDQPVPCAVRLAEELRPRVDLLIALTHIGIAKDRELAAATDLIDIILGGHSHTVLDVPEKVGRTWIAQGGSHARFAGRYVWEHGVLSGGLVPWKGVK